MSPRTGRPTECRKDHDVKVRIDDSTHKKIIAILRRTWSNESRSYSTRNSVGITEKVKTVVAPTKAQTTV